MGLFLLHQGNIRYADMVDDSLQKATDNMAGVIDRTVG